MLNISGFLFREATSKSFCCPWQLQNIYICFLSISGKVCLWNVVLSVNLRHLLVFRMFVRTLHYKNSWFPLFHFSQKEIVAIVTRLYKTVHLYLKSFLWTSAFWCSPGSAVVLQNFAWVNAEFVKTKKTGEGTRRTDGGTQRAELLQTDSFCRSSSCLWCSSRIRTFWFFSQDASSRWCGSPLWPDEQMFFRRVLP